MSVKPGKVYLIGAGPGDPGLLTRRGAELIGRSDVVVYDFLANPEFLSLARDDAEIIYVGKKGGDHTLPQGGINELLKSLAIEGKSVARLKGGDPFVFGRGGEEAEELVEAGIDYEIVPGVTSAVAAPAYAGIPISHRSFNSCMTLATGHEDPTKDESGLNWEAMAQTNGTLVLLMGMKNLKPNSQKLIDAGMDHNTPTALIRWGTTPRQRVLVSTLENIADDAQKESFGPPSIFIVGGVVGLRKKLAWIEKRPLWGMRILVTRTRSGAGRLGSMLRELGAEAVIFPTISISEPDSFEPLDQAIRNLKDYDWLVFTSVNGVKYFFDRLCHQNQDSRALAHLKICTIGPATGDSLAKFGLKPDAVPAVYKAEAAVEVLASEAELGKRFLLPRALEARQILPDELTRLGGRVDVVTAYQTKTPAGADVEGLKQELAEGEIHMALFTASSTIKNLAGMYPDEKLSDVLGDCKVGVIGPITAETALSNGLNIDVSADVHTLDGLVEALVDWSSGRLNNDK